MRYPHICGTVDAVQRQPTLIPLSTGIGCPDFLRSFTEPLEEVDPAGLVLFHPLGGTQDLTKTILIHGDRHQNGNIFVFSAPVAAQVDAIHVDIRIPPAL